MSLKKFAYLFIISLIPAVWSCSRPQSTGVVCHPVNGSAWQVKSVDTDGDGKNELIYATYEGLACCNNPANDSLLWSHNTGSFIFDLAVDDIDNDGKAEILTAGADGMLSCLGYDGKLKWEYKTPYPLYNVITGHMTGQGVKTVACGGISRVVYLLDAQGRLITTSPQVKRLVHRMAAGNLDEDPEDEIFVIASKTDAVCMGYENGQLKIDWQKPLKVPEEYVNWENPGGYFYAFSVKTDDLDGDGTNEIIMGDTYFNKQATMVTDNHAQPKWISKKENFSQQDKDRHTEFYSTAFIETADVFDSIPGKEVISVAGGTLRIYSSDGRLLSEAMAKTGFTDVNVAGKKVWLGSSPNGDHTVYELPLNKGIAAAFQSIERTGRVKRIGENIARLTRQAEKVPADTLHNDIIYRVNPGFRIKMNGSGAEQWQQQSDWWYRDFPYKNIKLVNSRKVIENNPPLNPDGNPWSIHRWNIDAINGTMSVDSILKMAAWVEKNKIPTFFYIGHSVMPFIRLQTAYRIAETAPEYCLGFQTAEDEDFERIPVYLKHYFDPLSQFCARHNMEFTTKNKNTWWASVTAYPEVSKYLFNGDTRKTLSASTEDSNSRTPGINLMARYGLYLAGMVKGLTVNVHQDMFSFNRFFQWEYPKHGHPFLRLMVAHTLLGGNTFNIRIPYKFKNNEDSIMLTRLGDETVKPFMTLLGKGIIFSPKPGEAAGTNETGIVFHPPSKKWLNDAINGHAPETWQPDPELEHAVIPFNGCLWGMVNTPDFALEKIMFHKNRQFGTFIPATPYGLIPIVPASTDLNKVTGVKHWIHTDGIYIWTDENHKMTGREAAAFARKEFEKSAKKLPFRTYGDDVFMQVLKLQNGRYRIVLIDPGWVDPADRNIVLVNQTGKPCRYQDVLSGEISGPEEQPEIKLTVRAGIFRIIETLPSEQP